MVNVSCFDPYRPPLLYKLTYTPLYYQFGDTPKDSFLRALREVVPEMELFLENHGQYIHKEICDKINLHTKLYISPFCKKIVS